MVIQLQPDPKLPAQVYELANSNEAGTPLKRLRRRFIEIVFAFGVLCFIAAIGYMGYDIYAYIAFIYLSHIYPNVNSVPANQLDNYLWLQVLHDNFWRHILTSAILLGHSLTIYITFLQAYRTRLYICTEGLLKIYKKKIEAIRWDAVKEFDLAQNYVSKLVKQDGSTFIFPSLLISGNKTASTLITDEIAHYLLPAALASYERGEKVSFGDLAVDQDGISRPGEVVHWQELGDVALENGKLSLFYRKNAHTSTYAIGKWHAWQRNKFTGESWPNLPIFMALVNAIREKQPVNYANELAGSQQRTLKEVATLVRIKNKRTRRISLATIIIAIVCLFSLFTFYLYQTSMEQTRIDQARAARDQQLVNNYLNMMKHKPYYAHVPGQHCDHGKGFWYDDDKDTYTCQSNGLLMTMNDTQYEDETHFTFEPNADNTSYPLPPGGFFVHHYRLQVKAAIVSQDTSICVYLHAHVQDFQGDQQFEVCDDGTWGYYRCDVACNTVYQISGGTLPKAEESFLFAVDVTDKALTLIVDNKTITTIPDTTYSSTDEVALGLSGDAGSKALFSDFSYAPYQ